MKTNIDLRFSMMSVSARLSALVLGSIGMATLGCATTPVCRKGPKDDITMAARTTGEAVKTGAKTGVEGIKAAGEAVGGWVEGGSSEAKEKWREGKADTKATAREGTAETRYEADVPPCD